MAGPPPFTRTEAPPASPRAASPLASVSVASLASLEEEEAQSDEAAQRELQLRVNSALADALGDARPAAAGAGEARGRQVQRAPSGALAGILEKLPVKLDGRMRGLILLNIMTLIMSSNWMVVKTANEATMTDTTIFMSLRFALAAAVFAPFFKPDARVFKAGVQVGVWYAAGYIAQSLALAGTSASRASLLSTFTVLAVPVIGAFNGQHIRPIVWACAAAALVGTGMLEEGSSLGGPNVGDAWAVASAVFFAFQIFFAERNMRRLPPKSELPLMAVAMFTVATLSAGAAAVMHFRAGDFGAVAAGLKELLHDWQAALPAALGGGAAVPAAEAAEAVRTAQQLFYTALFSTNLVLLIELFALQDVSSTDAAMIYSLEPVLGALMAYAFLGERWGAWGWAGGGVILAASLLTQFAGAVESGSDSDGGGRANGNGDGKRD